MIRISTVLLLLSLFLATPIAGANEVVDLNTADATTLARVLVGVGKSKADAIVAHRDQFGPFKDVEELQYVKGIGAATIEANRDRMTVGGGQAPRTVDTATVAER